MGSGGRRHHHVAGEPIVDSWGLLSYCRERESRNVETAAAAPLATTNRLASQCSVPPLPKLAEPADHHPKDEALESHQRKAPVPRFPTSVYGVHEGASTKWGGRVKWNRESRGMDGAG